MATEVSTCETRKEYSRKYKNKILTFVNQYRKKLYETSFQFQIDTLKTDNGIRETPDFLINRNLKIGFLKKSNRTGGKFKKHTIKIEDNDFRKRKCSLVAKNQKIVTTTKRTKRLIDDFFNAKNNCNDYTLIVISGNLTHDQCLFIRKVAVTEWSINKKFEVKIYESTEAADKIPEPTTKLLKLLNLVENNKNELIYNDSSHRLSNNGERCSVYVALEALLCMLYNRQPFNRQLLTCWKASTPF